MEFEAVASGRDVAVAFDIVKKAGAWFSYNDEKLGQGREKAKEYLQDNPTILAEVEAKVREKLKPAEITEEQ